MERRWDSNPSGAVGLQRSLRFESFGLLQPQAYGEIENDALTCHPSKVSIGGDTVILV